MQASPNAGIDIRVVRSDMLRAIREGRLEPDGLPAFMRALGYPHNEAIEIVRDTWAELRVSGYFLSDARAYQWLQRVSNVMLEVYSGASRQEREGEYFSANQAIGLLGMGVGGQNNQGVVVDADVVDVEEDAWSVLVRWGSGELVWFSQAEWRRLS
jgi:hypothetical protein